MILKNQEKLMDEFTEKFENPYVAASHGTVDNVINPAETRPMLIEALVLASKVFQKTWKYQFVIEMIEKVLIANRGEIALE